MVSAGTLLHKGQGGVPVDLAAAHAWFKRAAELHESDGMRLYAWMLHDGVPDVEPDPGAAVTQMLASAELRNVSAAYDAAVWLAEQGDVEGASRWFRVVVPLLERDAANGSADAQRMLAWCRLEGHELPVNRELAITLLEQAAAAGCSDAMFDLSLLHHTGRGVRKSHAKVVFWCSRAAAAGCALALFKMGECAEFGTGVPKSLERANAWYVRAASRGVFRAREKIAAMSPRALLAAKANADALVQAEQAEAAAVRAVASPAAAASLPASKRRAVVPEAAGTPRIVAVAAVDHSEELARASRDAEEWRAKAERERQLNKILGAEVARQHGHIVKLTAELRAMQESKTTQCVKCVGDV